MKPVDQRSVGHPTCSIYQRNKRIACSKFDAQGPLR